MYEERAINSTKPLQNYRIGDRMSTIVLGLFTYRTNYVD